MIRDSLSNAHAQKPQELHLSRVFLFLNLRREENRRLRHAEHRKTEGSTKQRKRLAQHLEKKRLNQNLLSARI